jgi:hypothetical protein
MIKAIETIMLRVFKQTTLAFGKFVLNAFVLGILILILLKKYYNAEVLKKQMEQARNYCYGSSKNYFEDQKNHTLVELNYYLSIIEKIA